MKNKLSPNDLTDRSSALLMRWMENKETHTTDEWTAADVQTLKEIYRIGLSYGPTSTTEDFSDLSEDDLMEELQKELKRK